MNAKFFPRIEVLEARIAPAAANFDLSSLNGSNGFKLTGAAADDEFGIALRHAGDINADGFDDFIVGAFHADPNGEDSGASYVVFGKASGFPANLKVSTLNGTNGFKISGIEPGDTAGESVSGAGDFNGDGFDDLLIGSELAEPNNSGASYIIFGKAGGFPRNFQLSTLDGSNGFKLVGVAADDSTGFRTRAAGDVNGDGLDDVIIGASRADPNGISSGASYVVFGRASGITASFALASLDGTNGFTLRGAAAGDRSGFTVNGAGDVNNDGFDDVIVGAREADPNGSNSGASYVVFGKSSGFAAGIELSALNGRDGFRLSGVGPDDESGRHVSGAGDFNGDGFDDVLIGAFAADPNGESSGASYVVFGKAGNFSANLDLSTLNGLEGFTINGAAFDDESGLAVSAAGDFNNDGFDDIIIGAPGADPNGLDSGASYVIFGRGSGFTSTLELGALDGTNGFQLSGVAAGDSSGLAVSGAGDVNGDGFDDVLVSAHLANSGGADTGASYVVFGFDSRINVVNSRRVVEVADVDGDVIRVTLNRGIFGPANLTLGPNGELQAITLAGNAAFRGANVIIRADQAGGGNGQVDVGLLDATGLDLKNVNIDGALEQIVVGDGNGRKAALTSLTVASLGQTTPLAPGEEYVSTFDGAVGRVTVRGDVQNAAVEVQGRLNRVTIGGDLIGEGGVGLALGVRGGSVIFGGPSQGIPVGAVMAGSIGTFDIEGNVDGGSVVSGGTINSVEAGGDVMNGAAIAAARIKVVRILSDLTSDDPADPVIVAALGRAGASVPAIDQLIVRGDVQNAQILLGYRRQIDEAILPRNADARAVDVVINGDWTASSLVAGVLDATGDGFGQNDTPIDGGRRNLASRIASIVIRGTATGSAAPGDHFGITAESIGRLTIDGDRVPLGGSAKADRLLDEVNGDFRVVELPRA